MSRPPKTRGAAPAAAAGPVALPTKPRAVRRTQAERRDASRARLLQAAFDLIAERGFRGTSFAAIAMRAGHSPSLVSHRFGSKEGLLAELVRSMVQRWGSDVRAPELSSRTGTAALMATGKAHQHALEHHAPAMRAMYMLFFESLIDAPELRTDLAQLDERLRRATERMLQAAVETGTARKDLDVSAHATLFLAALRGITLQWMMDPAALDLPRVYAALDSLFERGLR
jgi:AcrR family transcriptional regulator